MVILQKDVQPQ